MQENGNLSVIMPDGRILWHAGTFDNPGAYLDVNNGYFAIRNASGAEIWRRP
jgi:hypothetical protein